MDRAIITNIKIKLMQDAAKAEAKRLTGTGRAIARDGTVICYYPRSQRFAYFLGGRRVNRADVEKEW